MIVLFFFSSLYSLLSLLLDVGKCKPVCQPGFSLFSHYLLQYSCTLDGAQCEPCCSTVAPSMASHTASSQCDTPILIHAWFSHRNASASNCTQYSNEYPNLALSSSFAESANYVVVVDLVVAAAATLVFAVASDCRAAASAAAAVPRHACCVCFFLHT